jgi:hypothetical protein
MTASGSEVAGGPPARPSPARRDGRPERLVGRLPQLVDDAPLFKGDPSCRRPPEEPRRSRNRSVPPPCCAVSRGATLLSQAFAAAGSRTASAAMRNRRAVAGRSARRRSARRSRSRSAARVSDCTAVSVLGSANESGVERRRSRLLAGATCRSDAASAWPSLRGLRRGRRGVLALPRGLPGMALHLAAFRSGFLVACVARLLRGPCPLAPLHASRLRVRRDDAGKRHDGGQRTGRSSQSHSLFHARFSLLGWVALNLSMSELKQEADLSSAGAKGRKSLGRSYARDRWRSASAAASAARISRAPNSNRVGRLTSSVAAGCRASSAACIGRSRAGLE